MTTRTHIDFLNDILLSAEKAIAFLAGSTQAEFESHSFVTSRGKRD